MPLKLAFAGLLLLSIGGGLTVLAYASLAGDYDLDKLGSMPGRSVAFDRNGEKIGELHGANRIVVPLAEVSPHFRSALLVREDTRFYDHGGIDPLGIARAIYRNLAKDKREGASTITMQLARNSFDELMAEKTLHRKLVEIMLARRIEKQFTKDQILEFYVNRIFFGSGIYGIELAAQSYFGKPASALTLSESAMLAGIIRGPNRFSPFRHYDDAVSERDTVLARMLAEGEITGREHDEAKAERVRVLDQSATRRAREDSYALDAVRRELDYALRGSDAEDGGLRVRSSIDLRLQRAAEAALERALADIERSPGYRGQTRAAYEAAGAPGDPAYLQGAIVLLENKTGAVLASVGGRDIRRSEFNRATGAARPVGSAFKPFAYTAAFAAGLMPGTLIDDGPLRPREIAGAGSGWSPRNSDGRSLGALPADAALARSRNTGAVRVGDFAGLEAVAALAAKAGIDIPAAAAATPQMYLGNLDCTPAALAAAYTIFPNAGHRAPPFTVGQIETPGGTVLYRAAARPHPAAPPAACALTAAALQKVLGPDGTANRARALGFRAAAGGKTGTTDDFRDAWFVGFTDRVTCAVWVGFDQPASIGAYAGRVAVPIWTEVMLACERHGYRAGPLAPSMPLADLRLCRLSGCFAGEGCRTAGQSYDARIPYELAPGQSCPRHGTHAAKQVPRALPVDPRLIRSRLEGER